MAKTTKELLIQKLFSDQCTKEELRQLLRMIKKDPSETGPEIMMKLFQQLGDAAPLEAETSNEIFERIDQQTSSPTAHSTDKSKYRRLWGRIARVAAVFVFLAICIRGIQEFRKIEEVQQFTGYGEVKEIVLPDGSKVLLNGNSSLTYQWTKRRNDPRSVILEGEAYFDVRTMPDSSAKFLVMTNDLTVEVLGTVFNVNTRQMETSVFLKEGNVKVSLDHQAERSVYLEPGEVLQYSATDDKYLGPTKIDHELATSWRRGNLKFKDVPLREILDQLSQAHKLEFVIKDAELAQTEFTLSLPTEDMEITMSILSKLVGFSLHKDEERYIIDKMANERE